MDTRTSLWNNPDAGNHPLPDNLQEAQASIRAGERCMALFPYLGIRFGKRGDAFARTDSGYLTTLVRFPQGYVIEQVQWLSRVLSNRGMPRLLMEVHLEVLHAELASALPDRADDYRKLLDAAAKLREERRSVISQLHSDKLVAEFDNQSLNLIPNFGALLVSAVCDEARGIDAAVSSIADWAYASNALSPHVRDVARKLIEQSRQLAFAR